METLGKSGVDMRMSHWNLGGRETRKGYQLLWGQDACLVYSRVTKHPVSYGPEKLFREIRFYSKLEASREFEQICCGEKR